MKKKSRRKKEFSEPNSAMDSFTSPKHPKIKELEVTGVSRSGRVQKKTLKFKDDFEPPKNSKMNKEKRINNSGFRIQEINNEHNLDMDEFTSEIEFDDVEGGLKEEDSISIESPSDEEDDGISSDEKEIEFSKKTEPQENIAPMEFNNLYAEEKKKKKNITSKDENIVGKVKAQRKDKGKTRFTAYMLWAKDIRQELTEKYPYMDFSTISKRLGELWASVPNIEKYNWQRRAKRLAAKHNSPISIKTEPKWKISPPSTKKKSNIKIANGKDKKSSSSTRRPMSHNMSSVQNSPLSSVSSRSSKNMINDRVNNSEMYKVVGTQPVDVAAHLKLLGESLTIIGERLMEHEGQIAVSGSVSVLLDSLLCALGPLMCLTQQIPETNSIEPDTFTTMLDNIAYIMPGL